MTRSAKNVRVNAFAKINLTLRVLGVRPDGYHELRTTFQAIDLHDTLTFAASREFAIDCEDASCPRDRSNLVWRAAEELWRASGRRGGMPGAHVTIVKRIPAQAGLGGGSSDAAAALRALAVLWKVKHAPMAEIAARLGADVAFFLEGGTALGVERGDVLFPLADAPPSWVLLVLPNFGVSTKDAYAWFDAYEEKPPGGFFQAKGVPKTSRWFFSLPEPWNDLQRPVEARHPEIARIVDGLRRAGAAYGAMSGSGSAVFGLYAGRSQAQRAARVLGGPGRRIVVTRTLGRSAFLRRSRPV